MSVSQNLQYSNPVTKSPFGNLPFGIAQGVRGGFSGPLGRGFGYQEGKGPLADFINQATGITSAYLPDQTQLAKGLFNQARSSYGGYQQSVDQFLNQLPGFQNTMAGATGQAGAATGAARTALDDVMSPLQSRATFQEASRRALAPAREGMAARGLLEGGQAQAGEQQLLSDLAFQTLQADNANKQAAIQGLTGAATGEGGLAGASAQLAGMGPEAQGQLFGAQPSLAQLLTQSSNLPLAGAQNLLGFLTSTQEPNMALLRMVLPTVANKSFGGGGTVGM